MASSQPPRAPPAKPLDLEVIVVSVKHLKNVNWQHGDLKPYYVAYLNPDRRVATKPDDAGNTCPIWNKRLFLPLRPFVLDEDTYMATIEKIIERYFFPDIPKLRDRLNWLEAIRNGDPVLIRNAQLKILEWRAIAGASKTSAALDITATSNRSRTPGSTFPVPFATPFGFDQTPAIHLPPGLDHVR